MSNPDASSAPRRALLRSRRVAAFAGNYLLRFLRANYEVAKEIVTPGDGLAPAIVEVPLRSRTRFEIASYISLVSLSPGTVALALSEDRSRLAVHGMHAGDPEHFRADLRALEEQMLAAWRSGDAGYAVADDAPTERRTT
ncbi:Na+/H+ antiporter subunit E [Geodermatophilus obscurus]|jgi:multicomponent Na+:H+ antiporter subunit E|uniref:Multisubunit Na+/H+ antiporter MnhE subunit-like protein n=1 Tax=Geodermatophilus obscurus (strain ATCC 25078 / DSM 43160 / JCM 3152 / CCUG 61914 / KCC A-0152 / KCTC 9177 / NBRC 13315 / NRRL B-3577 / G-20) TaxID=526225 RepID=D2S7T9_GEOOG|nr:Na+/H+ antiporter subunit E [Geodermatophilus obscurus]ADB75548.1 Multisubunit Na+/H+ antiporter MnhE subunit- like protein [Geodermatophilus obscurus DSM 43160]